MADDRGASVVADSIDRVTTYLMNEFRLKDWEARPIAADVVVIVVDEIKKAQNGNQ